MLSFDDCYLSFFEQVSVYCEASEIPYTLFVSPGLMEDATPWWNRLDVLVQKLDLISMSMDGVLVKYKNRTRIQKMFNYSKLSGEFKLQANPDNFTNFLKLNDISISDDLGFTKSINLSKYHFELFAGLKFATFGSHGYEHLSCKTMSASKSLENFLKAQSFLMSYQLNISSSVCFPYGHTHHSNEFSNYAQKAGIKHAFTTRLQHINSDALNEFEIGRLVMTSGMDARMTQFLDSTIFERLICFKLIARLISKIS